ncbi:iron-siderophore ABC transporter substrate-binding protein, partial [Streptomyces sp. NPDC085466]
MFTGTRPAPSRFVGQLPYVAVVTVAALALSACGGGSEKVESKPAATSAGGEAPSAFPVTVEHKYGSTTID